MKAKRFRLLAAAALSDGTLDPNELATLRKAASEFGVAADEVDGILEEIRTNPGSVKVSVPADATKRAELFRSLIDVVAADGKIDAKEQALLMRIGPFFDLNEIEVEDILRSATAKPPRL
ncbi:MAG: TerB family tellurite resistance protein [Planctomycetes bacterium]|nr:TerB family tellurite resistance protein [Planctomycetota bacterium]